MSATLISHVDTTLVTRKQLASLLPVVPTETFKPVSHIELIETLEKTLKRRGVRINREEFALRHDGSRLFGVFDLDYEGVSGSCASMGLRTANDKSMSIQICAGLRVFVCDNMCFNSDMVALKRKHTSGLNLFQELEEAVNKYERHFFKLKYEVENLKGRTISDDQAKAMIYDVVFKHKAISPRFGEAVGDEYFNPRHAAFTPRTAWSLHNAFTEVVKQIKAKEGASALNLQMEASQEIGKYFGLVSGKPALRAA